MEVNWYLSACTYFCGANREKSTEFIPIQESSLESFDSVAFLALLLMLFIL